VSEIWTNWAGDQRCAPELVERPGSEEEIVAAAGRARDAGRPLRVAGSGHSFTDIACTDGHQLHLGRMHAVRSVDPDAGLAEVEAGMRLRELGPALAEHGRALENMGDIDAQAVAGAISTATHGTGARFGNLSVQIAALRMVTADGEVLECSEESDPELFLAARVGLGSLGVISTVTFRTVPLFTLRRVDEGQPLDRVLAELDRYADENDHFEFYVFPYADTALTRSTERSDREPDPVDPRLRYLQDVVLENKLMSMAVRTGRAVPSLIPRINNLLTSLVGRSVRFDHSHRVFASKREVPFTEMEYAVPREAGAEAVRRVMDLVERRRIPVGFPIEVRFVAADDAFLSPSNGRDTCYIAVHMFRGMDFESYFRGVESIMDDYEGRPHWGKRHYQSAATLSERYPDWERFAAVRSRLDPGGLFRNDYLDRVLGPLPALV
jgi:L-gulono-1,4-lactone dehydrogenase